MADKMSKKGKKRRMPVNVAMSTAKGRYVKDQDGQEVFLLEGVKHRKDVAEQQGEDQEA